MPKADALGVDDVLEVLSRIYGLEGEKRRREFYILCPSHNDHEPSASVNLDTGYWNCWSCKAGGDLADLGKVLLGRKRSEILKLLVPNEPSAIAASVTMRVRAARRDYLKAVSEKKKEHPALSTLQSLSKGPLDYLIDRGFTKETLKRWSVRYCNEAVLEREDDDPFTITDCVAIPIKTENDEVWAWCYRATEASPRWLQNARYIYTPGAELSETWFGLQHNSSGDIIGITEGALDAMWLDQHGFPALAILGSTPKEDKKIRKLADFKEVRLFVDNDNSGHLTTWALGESLTNLGVPVTVALRKPWMVRKDGKKAKDANDLCGTDLELCWHRAIPFLAWKRRALALAS